MVLAGSLAGIEGRSLVLNSSLALTHLSFNRTTTYTVEPLAMYTAILLTNYTLKLALVVQFKAVIAALSTCLCATPAYYCLSVLSPKKLNLNLKTKP